jgi:hypothetical protein
MAMTLDELRGMMDGCGLKYFVDPNRPALMLGMRALCGDFQFVAHLEEEGRFLQFRTLNFCRCPEDHPHLGAVLRVLATLDYQFRFLKFGWDRADGEIVAYGDVWLEDAKVSPRQFRRLLDNFIPGADLCQVRIRMALETGQDPGPIDSPEALRKVAERQPGSGGWLRTLLDKVTGGKGAGVPPPPPPPIPSGGPVTEI